MTIQVLQNNKNLIDKGDFINLQLFILDDLKVPTNAVHWMHLKSSMTSYCMLRARESS